MNGAGHWRKVSIIIPAFNAEGTIGRTLESIRGLDYPSEKVEVLVVDNGSRDGTRRIAEEQGARFFIRPGDRVGGLRNYGGKMAGGDILAFLDADCLAPGGWLKEIARGLREEGIGAAGGGYLARPGGTWVERAWVGQIRPEPARVHSLPAGNMALRRKVFEEIGGFDEDLPAAEDDEICRRLRGRGYGILSHPGCFVVHLGYPRTLSALARKQMWYGQGLDLAKGGGLSGLMLAFTISFGLSLPLLAPGLLLWALRGTSGLLLAALGLNLGPVLASVWNKGKGRRKGLDLIPLGLIFEVYYLGRCASLYFLLQKKMRRPRAGPS